MLRIALCDDDKGFVEEFQQMLSRKLAQYDPKQKYFICHSGRGLLTAVKKAQDIKESFDIIFLDIEMPEMNGFEVAKKLRRMNSDSLLVFVTNDANEIAEGYVYRAAYYLVKEKLLHKINQCVKTLFGIMDERKMSQRPVVFRIQTSKGEYIDKEFYVNDILYLKSVSRRVLLYMVDGTEHNLLVYPLSQYHDILKAHSEKFEIITRNTLLNFRHVEDVVKNHFRLSNGEEISLGGSSATRKISKDKHLNQMGRK